MSKQIKIETLDPQSIPDGSVCVFVGKRKTGKSCAIRDLMWHKKYIPIGQVISGSETANPFFNQFFPKTYIDDEYSEEILSNILKRQRKIKQFAISKKTGKKVDPRFCLVFDDCLHDNRWKTTTNMKSVFMNGRHYSILFILALQYCIGIPPNLRSNIDYIFIFRDNSIINRKKLYENYGGCIPSFQMFSSLMDNLDKFECLVICSDPNTINFNSQIMYWKSTLRDPFKFGCASFWKQDAKLQKWKKEFCKSNPSFNAQWNVNKNTKISILKVKRH